MIPSGLQQDIEAFIRSDKYLMVVSGAGLSVASGIPTFRGKEGFWTIGSVNYKGPDIGTLEMFRKEPEEVWKWFLFRKGICDAAEPNEGHFLINEMSRLMGDRFVLVTQNVDGLHEKAFDHPTEILRVHGDLAYSRCAKRCTPEKYPFPPFTKQRGEELTENEISQLKCPACGGWLRPNVLWFDEYYNEKDYRFDTAQGRAKKTGLMLVVGTSGSTTAPIRMATISAGKQGVIVNIDPHEGFFSQYAQKIKHGYFLQENAEAGLKTILEVLKQGKAEMSGKG